MLDPKTALQPVTPEEMGIPSRAVTRFFTRLTEKGVVLHSALLLRHGRMLAEGYWAPFGPGDRHRMYSVSKSFTSAAVGWMIGQGAFSLEDRICDLFPEYTAGKALHPYLQGTTVRDLLRMTDCHRSCTYDGDTPDWVGSYFSTPPTHLPGQLFHYNTACTVLLAALVEKRAGRPLLQVLRDPLLDPIGFSKEADCIRTPCGWSWGGSGVLCTPRDLARFALVFLNGGRWGDRQLLPADYVAAATACQVSTRTTEKDIEMQQGYGYQFWRTRHNGFACRGMGSQLALCLPDSDFLLVTTGDTQDMNPNDTLIYDALWEELLPWLQREEKPLPPDPAGQEELRRCLLALTLPGIPDPKPVPPLADAVSGRWYEMDGRSGDTRFRAVSFRFEETGGALAYENDTGRHTLFFGYEKPREQSFPETHYSGRQIGVPAGRGYRTLGFGGWVDARTLCLRFFLADEYFGTWNLTACFSGDSVSLYGDKTAEWFLDEYPVFASGHARPREENPAPV